MRNWITGAAGLALAGFLAISPAGQSLAHQLAGADAPSPANGHAQVVAQGVIAFSGDPVGWTVATGEVEADDTDATLETDGPTFLVVDEGTLALADPDQDPGILVRLPAGEAALEAGDAEPRLLALGAGDVAYTAIGLGGDASDDLIDDTFTVEEGLRDLDLVRGSIEDGDRITLSESEFPVLVLVTEGDVEADTGATGPVETLAAGEAAVFTGEVTLESAGAEPAVVVAAVIGPEVELPERGTPVATEQPSQPTSPAPTPAPDQDGDGLSDAREADLGTDPANPDTDADGLWDGQEVDVYGSDPLVTDTDQDGLLDGDEVNTHGSSPTSMDTDEDMLPDYNEVMQHGTDPAVPDTDGDGISDHNELSLMTNPLDADSDDDGLLDGAEVDLGSDPNTPDTDQDGLLDGDEVNSYGSSPTSMDTDGDMLPDYNEVMQHGTNPTVADTDGDGTSDHDEVGGGYDPLDPNSHP